MMKVRFLAVAAAALLASCSSKNTERENSSIVKTTPDTTVAAHPAPIVTLPNLSFAFTGSGVGTSTPSDFFKMDTTHLMSFETRRKMPDGTYNSTRGFAVLEPQDFDSLRLMLVEGGLLTIDSTSVSEQCPKEELRSLSIQPTNSSNFLHLTFYNCATDYNLLTGKQRTYFSLFNQWIDRMRVKYRPGEETR